MNDNFVVFHLQKFRRADITGMELHLDRTAKESKNKDIDRSRSHLNYDVKDVRSDRCHLREKVNNLISTCSNYKTKKIRKDAIMFCSCIVSASSDFFKDKSPEYIQSYFECATDFLDQTFGAKNNVYSIVHMDEVGNKNGTISYHMHYGFCPLTEDGELSAKKIITRSMLRKVQDELPRYLQAHGYDVKRGVVNSPRWHNTTHEWKRDQTLLEQTQQELIKNLDVEVKEEKKFLGFGKSDNVVINSEDFEKIKAIAMESISMIQNNTELKRREYELARKEKELDDQEKEYLKKMKEAQKIADENTRESASLEKYRKSLEAQDKVKLYQDLYDGVQQEKEILKRERLKFEKMKESAVQRVSDIAKERIEKLINEMGEQGSWDKLAFKWMKEKYPNECAQAIKETSKLIYKKVARRIDRDAENEISRHRE